jgi:DivIVA domain-containing protein
MTGEVRSTTISEPPVGKRGYDEKSVDDFLDALATTIAGLDGRA